MLKTKIIKAINKLGYSISKYSSATPRNSMRESYLHIKRLGFNPKVVIDVGVADGTFELYEAFPESFFVLIEPVAEYEKSIKKILKKYKGIYFLGAAGAENTEMEFNVHKEHLSGSSILKENMGDFADGETRKVRMIRCDDYIKENNLNGPFLLKIDVQGFELNVLEGAKGIIKDTEVISLEVSLFRFMKDSPDFFDVIYYMKNIGFVAYDIQLAWNRPLDNALGQVNMIFVKEDGFFRKDHAFGSEEQYKKFLEKNV